MQGKGEKEEERRRGGRCVRIGGRAEERGREGWKERKVGEEGTTESGGSRERGT